MFTFRPRRQAPTLSPSYHGQSSFALSGSTLCIVTALTERSSPIVRGFRRARGECLVARGQPRVVSGPRPHLKLAHGYNARRLGSAKERGRPIQIRLDPGRAVLWYLSTHATTEMTMIRHVAKVLSSHFDLGAAGKADMGCKSARQSQQSQGEMRVLSLR